MILSNLRAAKDLNKERHSIIPTQKRHSSRTGEPHRPLGKLESEKLLEDQLAEVGLFGNQNPIARPPHAYTLSRQTNTRSTEDLDSAKSPVS
jgi:hypothetical protein